MSIISVNYAIYVAVIILMYYLVNQKKQWVVLLFGSILFTMVAGIKVVIIPSVISMIAYFAAIVIENTDKEYRRKRKMVLTIAVIALITTLLLVKLKIFFRIGIESFIFPIGISYYSFSLISYVADVYWRKDEAEKNYFKLLLFTLYFPKILQGPISKHRNIKEKLYEGSEFDYKRFCFGLQRMLWGYFKKLVIADRLAVFVTSVFRDFSNVGGCLLFVGAILGAFQLYCDFSGCMDMALGLSEILGIELEENFRRPFFAKSAAEFWNRWHRTLGMWFTDYIYMPIVISPKTIKFSGKIKKWFGKRPAKSFMTILPVAIVWLITGLWHGTGLNYILWGLYWGILMIISNVFSPEIRKIAGYMRIDVDSQWFQVFRQFRTFFLFVISRILTIPSNVETSFAIYKKFFTDARLWELFDGTIYTLGLDRKDFIVAIVALIVLFYVMRKQEQGIVMREQLAKLPIVLRWGICYIGIFSVLIFGIYGPGYNASAFVYTNF